METPIEYSVNGHDIKIEDGGTLAAYAVTIPFSINAKIEAERTQTEATPVAIDKPVTCFCDLENLIYLVRDFDRLAA